MPPESRPGELVSEARCTPQPSRLDARQRERDQMGSVGLVDAMCAGAIRRSGMRHTDRSDLKGPECEQFS